MKQILISSFVFLCAGMASADGVSTLLISSNTVLNPNPFTDATYSAYTNTTSSVGFVGQTGTTPTGSPGSSFTVSDQLYMTATYKFGFTSHSNQTPPSTVYLHYAGNTVCMAPEPARPFLSYGAEVNGNSFFPFSSEEVWENTARYGIIEVGDPLSGCTAQQLSIPSSDFDGWTLVTSNSSVKIYVSTENYTITTPTAQCGGILGPSIYYHATAEWSYAMFFSG